ncbi:MAG: Fic family protein [Burkholderiales bacterium]|nr:Fic family protein [Burkholderiales bacterium]
MATEPIGYNRLIQTYHLPARPLARFAVIDSSVRGRQTTNTGDLELMRFETRYRPADTLAGDLQFALRYEGINLEVLALLFAGAGRAELEAWLAAQPESGFARRAGYLYEWLTGNELAARAPPKAAYVATLDEKLQFGLDGGMRNAKFRVIDNLPGNRQFCPLVRKTDFLQAMARKDLKRRTQETLARYDRDLLRRAAAFLYLKETHSSFEVEREKPSPDRARRFADLLREAESGTPLSESRLADLQNAVVDARFHEFSYRRQQNWIGEDLGYRKRIDFVPPRPENVSDLMNGLAGFSETLRAKPESMDPVVAAAALAFGFVFIHPFMDGNGRLHRYLIHEVLSSSGFTPKGIVLPVSAVILANLDRYVHALERFSRPLLARTTYDPDVPKAPATGNDALYFRYFDATEQASFLYWALERTVEHDLEEEIAFLLAFDAARARLDGLLDWPAHSLDLFVRLVQQNGGTLSKTKRESFFSWMTDDEVKRCEAIVVEAFRDRKNQNGAH